MSECGVAEKRRLIVRYGGKCFQFHNLASLPSFIYKNIIINPIIHGVTPTAGISLKKAITQLEYSRKYSSDISLSVLQKNVSRKKNKKNKNQSFRFGRLNNLSSDCSRRFVPAPHDGFLKVRDPVYTATKSWSFSIVYRGCLSISCVLAQDLPLEAHPPPPCLRSRYVSDVRSSSVLLSWSDQFFSSSSSVVAFLQHSSLVYAKSRSFLRLPVWQEFCAETP